MRRAKRASFTLPGNEHKKISENLDLHTQDFQRYSLALRFYFATVACSFNHLRASGSELNIATV